jgi:hypothetical protein
MKKNLFIVICLHFLATQAAWSQKNESEKLVVPVAKVTILEPGIAYEFPIGKKSTLFLRSGLTASLATDYYDEITGVLFRVFGSASGRVYYNFEKRNMMEKNTARNSANYFALLFLAATSPLNKGTDYDQELNNSLINTGIVWGMQRNYNSRVSLDLNIGIGYASAGDNSGVSPIGELNIGIWLGKK